MFEVVQSAHASVWLHVIEKGHGSRRYFSGYSLTSLNRFYNGLKLMVGFLNLVNKL